MANPSGERKRPDYSIPSGEHKRPDYLFRAGSGSDPITFQSGERKRSVSRAIESPKICFRSRKNPV